MVVAGVILAAGLGKRMGSSLPKALHPVGGRPMVTLVEAALRQAGIEHVVAVVSPSQPQVATALGEGVILARQTEALGTGHAVLQALPALAGIGADLTLVTFCDTPLLRGETLRELADLHRLAASADPGLRATLVTAFVDDPTGYGRIVRDGTGAVCGIVEQSACTPLEAAIDEIYSGILIADTSALASYLPRLDRDNAQGEYLLTALPALILADGGKVATHAADPDEVLGVNSRLQQAAAEEALRWRVLEGLMASGVTVIDPAATYIEPGVRVGADTTIWPGSHLRVGTVIGAGCSIGPSADLRSTRVGDRVTVSYSVIDQSDIGCDCTIGPFAHLRPGSVLAAGVKVGNYAEIKNTSLGRGTKVPHHSYVGDADVGAGVNVGAGAVFVNYDGRRKHRTTVSDGAFIGCNVNLIAPVKLGERAFAAAGSTITADVPTDALAVARSRQRLTRGWVQRRLSRHRAAGRRHPGRRGRWSSTVTGGRGRSA